ncbi:MAG: hypothetical protein ABIR62_15935, partial [Dokdonella sp.]|uniref:hypothetical protein n=1 Tax=Dokdonella sp. TaxID=2291710 RepID=UPI00326506B4
MTPSSLRFLQSRVFTGVSAVLACANAGAGTAPLYHLQLLDVPDSTAVQVKDINDAGVIVGSWSDQDFVRHAAFWDAGGMHELALPAGVDVDGIAYAINNLGQVVGTASDFVNPTAGIAWDITAPTTYTTIGADSGVAVNPADINDSGAIVGGFGAPSRAFVWTAADGFVDYGIQDGTVPDQQARWAAVNASGHIVGRWNQHVSNIHATAGDVGVPVVASMSADTETVPTGANAVNDAGIAVGIGLAVETPKLVPVLFAADGTFSEIPGATLDQDNGGATAINNAGVVVGTAGIGTANDAIPGLRAWVYRDNVTYNLFNVVDDAGVFVDFSVAVAINASGVIVGT